jgi:pre-rRNA-processing protein IPI3
LTKPLNYLDDELLRDQAYFLRSNNTSDPSSDDASMLRNRVADLETEIQQVKAQLGRAKGINDAMWDNVVQRVIFNEPVSQSSEEVGEHDNERKRKRGKT